MSDQPILTYINGVAITPRIAAALLQASVQLKAERGADAAFTLSEMVERLCELAPELNEEDAEALMADFAAFAFAGVANGSAEIENRPDGTPVVKMKMKH